MSCRFSYSISSTTSWICVERFVSAVPRWYLSPRPVSEVKKTSCPFSRSSGAKLRQSVAPPQAPCTNTKLVMLPIPPLGRRKQGCRHLYKLAQDAGDHQRGLERRAVGRRRPVVDAGRGGGARARRAAGATPPPGGRGRRVCERSPSTGALLLRPRPWIRWPSLGRKASR